MKIIIIALVLGVLMCSGCVMTPDYTGTYVGPKETLTLLRVSPRFLRTCTLRG